MMRRSRLFQRVLPAPLIARWEPAIDPALQAGKLLEQQFWCLGRDVILPRQNLLVRHGLEKHVSRNPAAKTSCYARRSPSGSILALWGFGAYLADPSRGAVLLSRWSIQPTVREQAVWPVEALCPEDLRMRTASASDALWAAPLLLRAIRWFGRYERFVRKTEGEAYLERTLADYPRPLLPRIEMSDRWEAILADLEHRNAAATVRPALRAAS